MITVDRWRKGKAGEYIGRAMPRQGLKGSPLGNPFILRKGDSRDEVLIQYSQYLNNILSQGRKGLNASGQTVSDEIERLTELARAGDLVLLCWCAPQGCHGDIIKEVIDQRMEELKG